ncbi:MAG: acyl-CoA dehydrogenase family protein [Thermodesulfobacteriota bacterium]|nr:acyl-CoA dehydrogenase family protein [Thermodesulfobacteriota bacterium]
MDFEFTDEQRMLKETARKLMEREIIPVADEYDRTKALMDRKVLEDLLVKLKPLGYLGGVIPEEAGGAGLDFISLGVIDEELSRAYASLGGVILIQQNAVRAINAFGTTEIKAKYLPGLFKGKTIACLAITEPNVGSNAIAVETKAVPDGEHYVLNGTKTWISNGSISDIAVIVAQSKGHMDASGICHVLVEREVSPYETRELPKMGLRSFPTSELIFEDCKVPKGNILVDPGKGLQVILHLFEGGRATMAIQSVGMAQAAVDASVRYAKERTQFGKPIGSFQMIQEMIADMITETEASRFLAYRAFSMLDKGLRCDSETSIAKLYATESAVKVTSKAIQIFGAYGLSEEYPVERYFRDARSYTIPDGATQIQKLIVARNALGISSFV